MIFLAQNLSPRVTKFPSSFSPHASILRAFLGSLLDGFTSPLPTFSLLVNFSLGAIEEELLNALA